MLEVNSLRWVDGGSRLRVLAAFQLLVEVVEGVQLPSVVLVNDDLVLHNLGRCLL